MPDGKVDPLRLYLRDGAQIDVVLSSHRKSCVIHGRLMYESQVFFSFKLDFLAFHPFLPIRAGSEKMRRPQCNAFFFRHKSIIPPMVMI